MPTQWVPVVERDAVPTVLIVDDDPETLNVLSLYFSLEGWTVVRAADGRQALEAVKDWSPDVMVLDWMMPGISGLDVAREIRQDPDRHLLPIVMLTARAAERDLWTGLRHGADAYLTKPVDMERLEEEVCRVVAQIRQLDGELGPDRAAPATATAGSHGP